jgi:AcrR family transcriptional regulator
MGVKERREREKQELRDKIMDAARAIFATEGYDAVSMRRIAEQIEYSPAAIYVHFPDKESLFREVVGCDFMRLSGDFTRLTSIADPVQRIRELGRTYIKFGTRHPNHYRLMFMTDHNAKSGAADKPLPGESGQGAYSFLSSAVEEAMIAGEFREELDDPALVTQTLWAAVHGVTSLQIVKGKSPHLKWTSLERRTDAMVDSILRGVLRDPGRLERT